MTLYLLKHDETGTPHRLHRDDGAQIGTQEWDSRPSKAELVEALADEYSGVSILGNPDARWKYTEVVTGDVAYRDLTIADETVPWR